MSEGGDAVCWLDRVCDTCGGFMEDGLTHDCSVRLGPVVDRQPDPPAPSEPQGDHPTGG